MNDLLLYVLPVPFGFFIGAFSTVGIAQDFQTGQFKKWRSSISWVLSTITGVLCVALLRGLAQVVALGPVDPNTTAHMLAIFVSCLAGAGLGGLFVMWPFLHHLSLGWKFFELFSDLKRSLSYTELRVLIAAMTPVPHLSVFGKLRQKVFRVSPPTPRERVMRELKLNRLEYAAALRSAVEKVRNYFKAMDL